MSGGEDNQSRMDILDDELGKVGPKMFMRIAIVT